LNQLLTILVVTISLLFVSAGLVYGHGVGSETFPPVEVNGNLITLEVSSSQAEPEKPEQQISIALIDYDSKVNLRDVIFHVTAKRGETFLFADEFQSPDGFIVFNFVSENTESVIIEEETGGGGFFSSLLGVEERIVNVKGSELGEGGLYKLDVKVIAADGYSNKLSPPPVFNSGISIAMTTQHFIEDPNFGTQRIDFITYYDKIEDFEYDYSTQELSFHMPFEWSEDNINQTSVVHEEFVIPKTYGDLYVSSFTPYINGVEISTDTVTIDDFYSDARIVHLIINQKELRRIFENGNNNDGMDFLIKPTDGAPFSAVTNNGQFRILTSWEPYSLKSGSNAKISFEITDVFLRDKPVSASYEMAVLYDDQILHSQKGLSTETEPVVAEFAIPPNTSGVGFIQFYNLDDNPLAKTAIPIIFDRQKSNEISIPEWVRNNAAWWSDGQIDDTAFVQAIEYLIKQEIIVIPVTESSSESSEQIPKWVRNNAAWWSDGQIDDSTFVQGLQFLIQKGIIRV